MCINHWPLSCRINSWVLLNGSLTYHSSQTSQVSSTQMDHGSGTWRSFMMKDHLWSFLATVSVALTNLTAKSNADLFCLRVWSTSYREVRAGICRQELMQSSWRKATPGLLSLFSYVAQDHLSTSRVTTRLSHNNRQPRKCPTDWLPLLKTLQLLSGWYKLAST